MKKQLKRASPAPPVRISKSKRVPTRRASLRFSPVGMALLLLAAVAVGLLLPGIGAGIQERSTDRLSRSLDLGQATLHLTSDDAKLEKLQIVGGMLNGSGDSIELNTDGRFMSAADASNKFDEVVALLNGTGLGVGQLTRTDVMESFPLLLVSDSSGVSTSLAWAVQYWKSTGEKWYALDYIVDDATGILLSAEYTEGTRNTSQDEAELLEDYTKPDWSGTAQRIMENLSDSYDFATTTMSLGGTVDLDRFSTMYFVNYTTNQGTVLGLPIVIGRSYWSINYYDG